MMVERELLKLAWKRAIEVSADAENRSPLLTWVELGCGKGAINNVVKTKLKSVNAQAWLSTKSFLKYRIICVFAWKNTC